MREIKFRAWWKKDKIMCEVIHIEFGDPNEYKVIPINENSVNWSTWWLSENEIDLIEYTTKKDKKQKEIHSGDIVKKSVIDRNGELHEWIEKVSWSNERLAWYIGITPLAYPYDYEIIGNIYENPELLEKE